MPANPDRISAEPKPNKNTEDINNRKNKENMPHEELSEKDEQKKNKLWAGCAPTDNQKSIQKEDSEWILTVNNKRKNIQRPLMEDLHIGNLTNDTTEEETMDPL